MVDSGSGKGNHSAYGHRTSSMGIAAGLGILAACLLSASSLIAQPKAFASLQPDRIETGDTAGLLILVSGLNTAPKDLDFSAWDSILPAANRIAQTAWRRTGAQWTRRFTLIAFDSATLELPPLQVRVAVGNPLETNGLTLSVFPTRSSRSLTDMAKIRDIRREPVSWTDYWPYAAGGILLMVLLFGWLRKAGRKKMPAVVPMMPDPIPISPTALALEKLMQLQQKQFWKQGLTKEHYAELSLILRAYLESQYQIAALESTTTEILQLLKTSPFPIHLRPDLNEILHQADMVKYAQSGFPEGTHEAILEKSKALIDPQLFKSEAIKQSSNQQKKHSKSKSSKYESL